METTQNLEFITNSHLPRTIPQKQKKKLKPTKFIKGLKVLCIFCGGKSCKNENYLLNKKKNAIKGLHSNWITPKILAMQRPSTKLIKKHSIIKKFKEKKINSIFCLQEPGEHPICGDGIHKKSGLSYLPEEFYKNKIHFYNFGWRDHETTDLITLLKIIKTMDFVLKLKNDNKIAVHCHAGKGRTGLVICGYMMFKFNLSDEEAVKIFKEKRYGSLKKKSQLNTLKKFFVFIKNCQKIYFFGNSYFDILYKEKIITFEKNDENEKNFYDFNNNTKFYIPKLIKKFFTKMKNFLEDFDSDFILECCYKYINKKSINYEKIKNEIKFENKFELFDKIKDPSLLIKFLIDFFEDLPKPYLRPITILNIEYLIDNHFSFENNFKEKGLITKKNINKDEIGLLFELYNFYKFLKNTYKNDNYEKSLFFFGLLFFDLKKNYIQFFKNDIGLFSFDWGINKKLKTFKEFFKILFNSDFEFDILKSNIGIMNSPLKKFSINLKNNSILSLKNYNTLKTPFENYELSKSFNNRFKENTNESYFDKLN